jgi:alkaline phosphatase D
VIAKQVAKTAAVRNSYGMSLFAPPYPLLVAALLVMASSTDEAQAQKPRPPIPVVTPIAGEPFVHAGPMVGHVAPNSANLWVKASNKAQLAFKVGQKDDLSDARVVEGPALGEDASFTATVTVPDLQPATRYYYAPVLDGRMAAARPYPSFTTAPPAGTAGKVRISLASCVGNRGYVAAAAFGEMAARGGIDLLLMLGDNHYANTTNPALLRDYYFDQRAVAGFTALTRDTPTYAIWDDHDYGPNNSDGTSPGKDRSLRAFKQWWANASYGEPDNPGVYGQFSRGDVDFFLLDVRYYRTPNKAIDDGTKTMLGARQLAWLKEALTKSRAKFKVIASGSEWQTLTQPDCWSSFARERQEIFDHISTNKIEGVVLVSGDRHFTAGYQVQGRFVEFTSGPIGSGNATLKENPERFTGADEGKLWVVLELDTTSPSPTLAYEIWQAGGGMLERRALNWDEINGHTKITPSPFPLRPARMEKKPPVAEEVSVPAK